MWLAGKVAVVTSVGIGRATPARKLFAVLRSVVRPRTPPLLADRAVFGRCAGVALAEDAALPFARRAFDALDGAVGLGSGAHQATLRADCRGWIGC